MARTSSAVLAALIAVAPLAAAQAQAPAEQTPPPVTAPAAPADSPAASDAAPQAETAPAASDTAPQGEAAAPSAADAAAAPAAAPAEGQPAAPQGDQVGSYYTKSTHSDWQLRCLRTQDGKDPCELYQLLRDESDTPVAEISVIPFTGEEAAAVLNFVAPLETDLQAGFGLQIDSGKNNRYPFIVCAPIGCISRLGMTQEELDTLKRGNKATVALLPFGASGEDNLVRLDMSLSGFTAGFTELQGTVAASQ